MLKEINKEANLHTGNEAHISEALNIHFRSIDPLDLENVCPIIPLLGIMKVRRQTKEKERGVTGPWNKTWDIVVMWHALLL